MSEATIRAQIKTILEGVSGIGRVHDYERWAATWEKYLEFFKTTSDVINGWTVSRVRTPAACASGTHDRRSHHYKIRGYYGLKDEDATEVTFQALVEAVCTAFRSAYQLSGAAWNT